LTFVAAPGRLALAAADPSSFAIGTTMLVNALMDLVETHGMTVLGLPPASGR